MSSELSKSTAILFVWKFCRHHKLYKWREDDILDAIGNRTSKFHFLADLTDLNGEKLSPLLLIISPRQDSFLTNNFHEKNAVFRIKAMLVSIKHPAILPVVDFYFAKEKNSFIVVHPFVDTGSLKDFIFRKVNPKLSYVEKYRSQKSIAKPLQFKYIACYGRQILEGLLALRSKGIVCQHLTTGNIIVHNGVARITGIENTLLAMNQQARLSELCLPLEESVELDLILFGHVLYEMSFAEELDAVVPSEVKLESLHPKISEVLRVIFFPAPVKEDYVEPLIEDIIGMDLFSSVELEFPSSLQIRLDSQVKSTLKSCLKISDSRRQIQFIQYKEKEALRIAKVKANENLINTDIYKVKKMKKAKPNASLYYKRNSYKAVLKKTESLTV